MEAKQTHTLTLKLDSQSSNTITPLPLLPSIAFPSDVTRISEAIELVNFKCYANIKSIGVAAIPGYELEDTETDRLIKTLNIEWESPRKQLNIYVGNPNSWFLIGSVSLLNTQGYPYRVYDLLTIYNGSETGFIGENVRLAAQIENVGFGLLQPNDLVTIYADFIRYISYFMPSTVVNNIINTNGNSNNNSNNNNNDNDNEDNTGDDNDMPYTIVAADTTLINRQRIICNNTSDINVTLPANPQDGWEVEILKITGEGNVSLTVPNDGLIAGIPQGSNPKLVPDVHKGGRFIYLGGNWYTHPDGSGSVQQNIEF